MLIVEDKEPPLLRAPVYPSMQIGFDVSQRSKHCITMGVTPLDNRRLPSLGQAQTCEFSGRWGCGDVETAHEDCTQLGCAVFQNRPFPTPPHQRCHAVWVPCFWGLASLIFTPDARINRLDQVLPCFYYHYPRRWHLSVWLLGNSKT